MSAMESALAHMSLQLDIEVKRWRVEADRADRLEATCAQQDFTIKQLGERVISLSAENENEKRACVDICTQLSVANTDVSRKSGEISRLTHESTALKRQIELLSARLEFLSTLKLEHEARLGELETSVAALSEGRDRAQQREGVARVQLDMQTHLNREIETRLEQALLGWKGAKNKEEAAQQRVGEMKASVGGLNKAILDLQRENLKLENRLKLYDALPLPDEIHMRLRDVEQDRTQLKLVIAALSDQLRANIADIQARADKNTELAAASSEVSCALEVLRGEHESRSTQCEALLRELSTARSELASLRESFTVVELENKELVASERRLKERLLRLDVAEEAAEEAEVVVAGAEDGPLTETGTGTAAAVEEDEAVWDSEEDERRLEAARVQDRLARNRVRRVLDGPCPEELLALLLANPHNESLVWRCARGIRGLVLEREAFRSQCAARLLDYMLLHCMRRFEGSLTLQTHVLRLLGALVYGNEKVRRRLGEEGLMALLPRTMARFEHDRTLLQYALVAVTNLAHSSLENSMRFLEAGGIERLVRALEQHGDRPDVQKHGCWAVLTLAEHDSLAAALVDKGVAAALANAMVTHRSRLQLLLKSLIWSRLDASVQQFCCIAFSNLALAGDAMKKQIQLSGVVELFRVAAENFQMDDNVVREAKKALHIITCM